MNCPNCKSALVDSSDDVTMRVGDETFDVRVPARRCAACDEVYTDAAALARAELTVAEHLANAGRVSGPALRFMRKALGLRAVDLAEQLDMSPETVSRWETGEREVPGFAFAVVGGLVVDRIAGRHETADRLRAIKSPRPTEGRVRLAVA
jgi:putative zinc finger/helix-turn-helix YgiT family protein